MPELFLLLGILLTGFLYRKHLKTRVSRGFCLVVASLFVLGHGMNILVIRLNGGKMPVIDGGQDWDNAPSFDLPDFIDEMVFEKYLPRAQKTMLLTDDPHKIIPQSMSDGVRMKFLADIYPIKIGGRHSLYSLGDVFIALGMMVLFIGIIPVWLISRRLHKRHTP